MEAVQLWISIVLGGMAVLTNMFLVYNYFSKKDTNFDKTIGINGATCSLKHKIIDDNYLEIKQGFTNLTKELQLFKENGLDHIEDNTTAIRERMAKLEGKNDMIIDLLKDVLKK